jgi:hypothetical protein
MMKMVKGALLATAATFAVAGAASAADLPVRKAPEKVFVEVCTNYEGYYRVPGTDTCVRIGGYVRFDWGYGGGPTTQPNLNWTRASSLQTSFTRWVLVMDARPMTDIGPARVYANIIAAQSSTQGAAYGFGSPWNLPANTTVIQNVWIQLYGFTFGYQNSQFDYLGTQYAMHTYMGGSDRWINQIAYTANVTKELSATISIEDPGARRYPIHVVTTTIPPILAAGLPAGVGIGTIIPNTTVMPNGTMAYFAGVAGKSLFPEIVGRLQYRGAWGDVAIMGGLHEVRPAYTALAGSGFPVALPAAPGSAAGVSGYITPDTTIGGAVQVGLTLRTPGGANPKISDTIGFEAAWARGALDYTLACNSPVSNGTCFAGILASKGSNFPFSKSNFTVQLADALFNPATGALDLTDSWNIGARYRHFWTPYLRSIHGFSWTEVQFNGPGLINVTPASVVFGAPLGTINSALVRSDVRIIEVNNELIWSPYTDLDLGIGVTYTKVDPHGPKSVDGWAGQFRAQWNW